MKAALRRKLFVIVIVVVVVAATVYGFLPKPVEVDLVAVSRGPLRITIEEEGRTRLKDRYVISAPTAGYLRRIEAKVGDPVRTGQIVATLEPVRSQALDPRSRAEAEAAVLAAQAGLAAALEKAKVSQADADYIEKRAARFANLFAKGTVAKDQFDQTQADLKKAKAAQDAAKAAVDGARADIERVKSTLRSFPAAGSEGGQGAVQVASPVGGAVFRLYRESEGAVGMGDPLMEVGNTKSLEVRVEVLSADAVKIAKGTPVLFKRWGGEGTLTGVVRLVEPAGFTKVSSLGVEEQRVLAIADITTPPEQWRALGDGYRLETHFIIWEGKDVLQVPAGALFRSGNEWAVFAAENGKARLRKVEIGRRNGLTAEILSGLKEGERVIAHPDDAVSDGVQIRAQK